jgi:hypothetical protein
MNDWGSCPNLYSISTKCFGIDANGGHEDDYVYYCIKDNHQTFNYDKMRKECLKCMKGDKNV